MINYSNILRIKIKSVYVKDFLISTNVRLKRGEHLHGEEPISSEPTFSSTRQAIGIYCPDIYCVCKEIEDEIRDIAKDDCGDGCKDKAYFYDYEGQGK